MEERGISMTCTEEYQERIEYTFHAFCKVVIRNAMYTALRTRSRKNKREISLDYLTDEKHYPLGTEDEYFIVPEPDEQYTLILCGDTVLFDNGLLVEALSRLPEQVTIKPENLSLGEKQKIYLARTLLGNSSCILLDEPGSYLDEKTEHSLINYLLKLKGKKLILVISHNAYYDAVADRTYEIRKGMMHQVQSH